MTPPSTTSRTLLANARILACGGDRDERPFDGDILIVKGYAQVKEAAVTRWRSAVAALLDHAPDPVRAGNPQG